MIDLLTAIVIASSAQHADPYLVAAVVETESKFDSRKVGSLGEIGLMQLRPEYFSKSHPKSLFNPQFNLDVGIRYLKQVEQSCVHKAALTYLVCYNAGITGGSNLRRPTSFPYYLKVRSAYFKLKKERLFARVEKKLWRDLGRSLLILPPTTNFQVLSSDIRNNHNEESDKLRNEPPLLDDQAILYFRKKKPLAIAKGSC